MAEVFALVGIVASIVQLVDFSSKVLSRLNEFQSSVDKVPTSFRNIKVDLPLLLDTLKHISKDISTGLIADEIQKSLLPVIEGCQSQIESLDVVLVKVLPAPGDSRTQRTRKAISSLSQEAKVEKIGSALRSHLLTLTFYYSVASSTLQPLKGKQILTGRKRHIH
jgi:N-terminal domain on NACHT_NTPase and P-loop NTPases